MNDSSFFCCSTATFLSDTFCPMTQDSMSLELHSKSSVRDRCQPIACCQRSVLLLS